MEYFSLWANASQTMLVITLSSSSVNNYSVITDCRPDRTDFRLYVPVDDIPFCFSITWFSFICISVIQRIAGDVRPKLKIHTVLWAQLWPLRRPENTYWRLVTLSVFLIKGVVSQQFRRGIVVVVLLIVGYLCNNKGKWNGKYKSSVK